MPTRPAILSINLGSSSLKYAAYRADRVPSPETLIVQGNVGIRNKADFATALDTIESRVRDSAAPAAIGHRVVFGGDEHVAPEPVTDALLRSLESLTEILPLHLPPEIAAIRASARHFAGALQVACFDTAFHASMPQVAKRVAIDRTLWKNGIRRYGFHGLSYEYIVAALGDELRERTIVAHLGSGSSLAAIRGGKPIDTTMGFSAMGGLMMGTRPGDIDPGVLIYLLRNGYDVERLNRLLEERCGLLGVSGQTADMAALLATRAGDLQAAEAIQLYVYVLRKQIGALAMTLGGLDLLVFTGGIGENAAPIRDEVVEGIAPLDPVVRVISTDENLMIARHTFHLIHRASIS